MAEIFEKGGVMMYPLAFCWVLLVAIIIERLIVLRRRRVLTPEVMQLIEEIDPESDVKNTSALCRAIGTPLARLVEVGLSNKELPRSENEDILRISARKYVRALDRWLTPLETIAMISPLMGLLGTVLGMVKIFNAMAEGGIGNTEALSTGISEALVTTIFGLSIAIPALVAYHYFTRRVDGLVGEIEDRLSLLVWNLHSVSHRGAQPRESHHGVAPTQETLSGD